MSLVSVERTVAAPPQRFELEFLPGNRYFTVETATDDDVEGVFNLSAENIPGLVATLDDVRRVHAVCDSILAVRARGRLVGGFSILPLNAAGLDRLLAGALDVATPHEEFLAPAGEKAAAVYAWALCVPGKVVGAMGGIMRWLRQSAYADCDIFARAGTLAGEAFMTKTGFVPVLEHPGASRLLVYRRPRPFVHFENRS